MKRMVQFLWILAFVTAVYLSVRPLVSGSHATTAQVIDAESGNVDQGMQMEEPLLSKR